MIRLVRHGVRRGTYVQYISLNIVEVESCSRGSSPRLRSAGQVGLSIGVFNLDVSKMNNDDGKRGLDELISRGDVLRGFNADGFAKV